MLDIRPGSQGNRFRAERIALLKGLVDRVLADKPRCRIIDVGGTYTFWDVWKDQIDWNRTEIVCANLNPSHASEGKGKTPVTMFQADARRLEGIENKSFDIAFSNSVIEHVGRWSDMKSMAAEIDRVADRHLVQTPNYWFPIEPHARTPFLHWIPEPLACRIVMMKKCGYWRKASNMDEAMQSVQSAHLLNLPQMATLFPASRIIRERFLGITKALIAIKG